MMRTLRDGNVQLVIAGPGGIGPRDRAALAVEEASGPGELGAVQNHNGRSRGHPKTPFPLWQSR